MVPRNSRLFTPRDFDYSPYFDIIKCPHLEFNKNTSYKQHSVGRARTHLQPPR